MTEISKIVGVSALALSSIFATSAMACEDNDQNGISPERQIVLDEVDALNGTQTGRYLEENGVGKFSEVSRARCSAEKMYHDGRYTGEVGIILSERSAEIATDATDEEYAMALSQFSVNLGHHICEISDIQATSDIEAKAKKSAVEYMSNIAHSEILFEDGLFEGVEDNVKALKEGDMSVCGEIRQSYKTLGLG